MKFLLNLFLNILDFRHKKKIINFLKIKIKNKKIIVLDVGAHLGESFFLFSKNFRINKIFCYELSKDNFNELKNKIKKKQYNFKYKLKNIGLGSSKKLVKFNYTSETSSTTICSINQKSNYFKYKNNFIKFFFNSNYISKIDKGIIDTLKNQLYCENINHVDLLKIDTEGYEFEVIKGLGSQIRNVNYILFEHHYDNMINKNYKFNDISKYLKENNFKQIFKVKMPMRRTFEYIYSNKNNIKYSV
jgi:FkbM family methyltransferase